MTQRPTNLILPSGYIFLGDAYDIIGEFKFKTQWTGEELGARSTEEYENELKRRANTMLEGMNHQRKETDEPPLQKSTDLLNRIMDDLKKDDSEFELIQRGIAVKEYLQDLF